LKVLFAIVVLFVLVATPLSMCAYTAYKSFDDFPEQARFENLNQRYAQLVADLNKAIDKSDSAYSLASALENISYPPETLFVEMRIDEEENTDAKDLPIVNHQFNQQSAGSGSKLRIIINGGGYGHANDQHYWVFQHPLDKYGYKHIEILFAREVVQSEKE